MSKPRFDATLTSEVTKTHDGRYISVFSGKSEVIVYGSGSDWMVQYANVTNGGDGWRRWFSDRTRAEEDAKQLAAKEYKGMRK